MDVVRMPNPERDETLKLSQVAPGTLQCIKEQQSPIYSGDSEGLEEAASHIDSSYDLSKPGRLLTKSRETSVSCKDKLNSEYHKVVQV